MKSDEEIMEILEAFDLTQSYRDAAELAACSPNTVARYVEARDQGRLSCAPARRDQLVDAYADKLEEWLETSNGKVRADVVHDKLAALGYTGSERTTRRAVAAAKKAYRAGRRRRYRPWVPEPGMWPSSTGATARWSPGCARGCSVPGWPGAATGSCWP